MPTAITAAIRYEQLMCAAKSDLSLIDDLLTNHVVNNDPIDWEHVGDVSYVAEHLADIRRFLIGYEED